MRAARRKAQEWLGNQPFSVDALLSGLAWVAIAWGLMGWWGTIPWSLANVPIFVVLGSIMGPYLAWLRRAKAKRQRPDRL